MVASRKIFIQEPSLREIIFVVWKQKVFIVSFAALFFILSLLIVSVLKEYYRAEAVISPSYIFSSVNVNNKSTSVDIEEWMGGDYLFEVFMNIVKGKRLADKIDDDLEMDIMLKDCIIVNCQNDYQEGSLYFSDYLKRNLKIENIGQSKFKKIYIDHPDSTVAAELLAQLIVDANSLIGEELKDSLVKRIDYLETKLSDNLHPDHKKDIVSSIVRYEYLLMQAKIDTNIAVKYIEPVYLSSKSVWPRKYMFVAFLTFFGMIFGYIVATIIRK